MQPEFQPIQSAESSQLSNAPVLGMAAHMASLDIFDEVGMTAISKKREDLTAYLEFIIHEVSKESENANFERSEEHTSELQSRPHLVCRLLLEKKKKKK